MRIATNNVTIGRDDIDNPYGLTWDESRCPSWWPDEMKSAHAARYIIGWHIGPLPKQARRITPTLWEEKWPGVPYYWDDPIAYKQWSMRHDFCGASSGGIECCIVEYPENYPFSGHADSLRLEQPPFAKRYSA